MLTAEIIGNLGANAEIRNNEYITFRVAHTDKIRSGETVTETTTWVSVTTSIEKKTILPYLTTGTKVFVRGKLSARCYIGNDGHHHAGINIRAFDIELCGGNRAPAAPTPQNPETPNTNNNNLPF